ncbi:hypothetical protein SAM19_05270 [Brevibacillus laterosporus]|nr:hypothetical protein [Brevibacillus laterosporus]
MQVLTYNEFKVLPLVRLVYKECEVVSMKTTKGIIDRFEEGMVVVEIDGQTYDLPISIFQANVQVGQVINISTEVDQTETEAREKEANDLMDDLFE